MVWDWVHPCCIVPKSGYLKIQANAKDGCVAELSDFSFKLTQFGKTQTNPFMFWSGLCLVATKANTYFPSAFKRIKAKNHHGPQKGSSRV